MGMESGVEKGRDSLRIIAATYIKGSKRSLSSRSILSAFYEGTLFYPDSLP